MTLAASGQISMGGSTASQSINLEVGSPAFAQSSLNDPESRRLSTKTTNNSVHSLTDFYSKTFANPSGTLWLWGRNGDGELGVNTYYTPANYSPVQVAGTTWRKVGGDHNQSNHFSFALKTDNTLWGWGYAFYGVLGNNSTIARSSPIQIAGTTWRTVFCGGYTNFGLKTNGTLWGWGDGSFGCLGVNSTPTRSSPVQIAGTTWRSASGGGEYNKSAGIKTDNTLWTWGEGYDGLLGINNTIDRSSPVQVAGTNWNSIAEHTWQHNAAIKTDGTLWTWGGRAYASALGVGLNIIRSSPVQVAGTNWHFVDGGRYFTAALKTDGTLWAWGHNSNGQLAQNNTTEQNSPVQVAGESWKILECRQGGAVAIKTDGTVWNWGYNTFGGITSGLSPVQIGGTAWKLCAGSKYNGMIIK